jgi:ribosomal protein L9
MEIILLENILNLGNIGDKVIVKMVMEEIFF